MCRVMRATERAHRLPAELAADVCGFIRQETEHRNAHRAYNDLLAAQGHPVDALEQLVRTSIREDLPEVTDLPSAIAADAALELWAAVFSKLHVSDTPRDDHGAPLLEDAAAELWYHHCQEELEHADLAGRVFDAVVPDIATRRAMYSEASAARDRHFTACVTSGLRHVLRSVSSPAHRSELARELRTLVGHITLTTIAADERYGDQDIRVSTLLDLEAFMDGAFLDARGAPTASSREAA